MNIKKILLSIITIGMLIILIVPPVYADDSEHMSKPDEGEGALSLLIERYDLNRYKVNNEDEENRFKGALISLNNGLFQITGLLVELVDTSLEHMFSIDMLNTVADDIANISYQIYLVLKLNFGELLFVFACGYIIWLAFSKGTFRESLRRSLLFVAVLVVAGYWTLNAGDLIRVVNNLSEEAQEKILSTGNTLIDVIDEGNGVFADTSNITGDETIESTLTIMRNLYFDLAFERPYLFMNFGNVNKEEINNNDLSEDELSSGINFNRVDRLLAFKNTKDGQELRLEYVKGDEVDELGNAYMGGGNAYYQLAIAFISPFLAIGLGIPFFILASFNFIIQLFVVLILFCIPFAFILSYVPQFAMSGFKMIGYLITAFVIKVVLSLFILFVYLTCYLVDKFLPPTSLGMYLLNVAVLVVLLFLMIIKRDMIIKVVTAGRVQSLDGGLVKNVNQNMVNPAFDKLKDKLLPKDKYTSEMPSVQENSNVSSSNNKTSNVERKSQQENKPQEKGVNTSRKEKVNRTPQVNNADSNKGIYKENKEESEVKRQTQGEKSYKKPQSLEHANDNENDRNEGTPQEKKELERMVQQDLNKQEKPKSVENKDRKLQSDYVIENKDVEREKPQSIDKQYERHVNQNNKVVNMDRKESRFLDDRVNEKIKNDKPNKLGHGTYEIEKNKIDLRDSKGSKNN